MEYSCLNISLGHKVHRVSKYLQDENLEKTGNVGQGEGDSHLPYIFLLKLREFQRYKSDRRGKQQGVSQYGIPILKKKVLVVKAYAGI